MKKHWDFKLYNCLVRDFKLCSCLVIGILLIQLLPFLWMGKWYVFMILYTTAPFPILFEPLLDKLQGHLWSQISIVFIASSCAWALIVFGIIKAIDNSKKIIKWYLITLLIDILICVFFLGDTNLSLGSLLYIPLLILGIFSCKKLFNYIENYIVSVNSLNPNKNRLAHIPPLWNRERIVSKKDSLKKIRKWYFITVLIEMLIILLFWGIPLWLVFNYIGNLYGIALFFGGSVVGGELIIFIETRVIGVAVSYFFDESLAIAFPLRFFSQAECERFIKWFRKQKSLLRLIVKKYRIFIFLNIGNSQGYSQSMLSGRRDSFDAEESKKFIRSNNLNNFDKSIISKDLQNKHFEKTDKQEKVIMKIFFSMLVFIVVGSVIIMLCAAIIFLIALFTEIF